MWDISEKFHVQNFRHYLRCKGRVQLVPGLSSDPPRHREYRNGGVRWETTGKIRQSKLQQTAFVTEVKPLSVYQSTYTYILLAALIFPK